MEKRVEQKKSQPSPVIGSTRLSHRGDRFPRLVQIGDVAYAQNKNNDRIIAAHYYGGLHEDSGGEDQLLWNVCISYHDSQRAGALHRSMEEPL